MAWTVCLLVAALLFVAAWTKWWPPYSLAIPQLRTIFDDSFPPGTLRRDVFIAVEFVTSLWLLVGWRRRAALLWTALLFLGFTVVLGYELTKPDPRTCGCLPVSPQTGQAINPRAMLWQSLARNLVALLAIGWAWLLLRPSRGTTHEPQSCHGSS